VTTLRDRHRVRSRALTMVFDCRVSFMRRSGSELRTAGRLRASALSETWLVGLLRSRSSGYEGRSGRPSTRRALGTPASSGRRNQARFDPQARTEGDRANPTQRRPQLGACHDRFFRVEVARDIAYCPGNIQSRSSDTQYNKECLPVHYSESDDSYRKGYIDGQCRSDPDSIRTYWYMTWD
jgi:hypothetical protein